MGKTMTALQLAANKQNALKSTGPRTTEGRAIAKFNALKHGILSKQALIKGGDFSEKGRDLAVLHQRFRQDLKPVGVTEEMLVDQIVTATWRLQRAVRAESAGIALEADEQQERRESGVDEGLRDRLKRTNTFFGLNQTAGGTVELMYRLEDVMEMVEKEGELTEAAIKQLEARFDGKPNRLTREVDERRLKLAANPDGLDPNAFEEYKKKEALDYLVWC